MTGWKWPDPWNIVEPLRWVLACERMQSRSCLSEYEACPGGELAEGISSFLAQVKAALWLPHNRDSMLVSVRLVPDVKDVCSANIETVLHFELLFAAKSE